MGQPLIEVSSTVTQGGLRNRPNQPGSAVVVEPLADGSQLMVPTIGMKRALKGGLPLVPACAFMVLVAGPWPA